MQVFLDGKPLAKPVVRYGSDNKPAFVADAEGDKTWRPASEFTFEDKPATAKKKTTAPKTKKKAS